MSMSQTKKGFELLDLVTAMQCTPMSIASAEGSYCHPVALGAVQSLDWATAPHAHADETATHNA